MSQSCEVDVVICGGDERYISVISAINILMTFCCRPCCTANLDHCRCGAAADLPMELSCCTMKRPA